MGWEASGDHAGGITATAETPSQVETEAQVTAEQRMAGEEESDADGAWGRKVLTGAVTGIHPFRDVNLRSQFVFFNELAARG